MVASSAERCPIARPAQHGSRGISRRGLDRSPWWSIHHDPQLLAGRSAPPRLGSGGVAVGLLSDLGVDRRQHGRGLVRARLRRPHGYLRDGRPTRHYRLDSRGRVCQHRLHAVDATPHFDVGLAPGVARPGRTEPGRVRSVARTVRARSTYTPSSKRDTRGWGQPLPRYTSSMPFYADGSSGGWPSGLLPPTPPRRGSSSSSSRC